MKEAIRVGLCQSAVIWILNWRKLVENQPWECSMIETHDGAGIENAFVFHKYKISLCHAFWNLRNWILIMSSSDQRSFVRHQGKDENAPCSQLKFFFQMIPGGELQSPSWDAGLTKMGINGRFYCFLLSKGSYAENIVMLLSGYTWVSRDQHI